MNYKCHFLVVWLVLFAAGARAQNGRVYERGYYYDSAGRYDGYIAHANDEYNTFLFKIDPEANYIKVTTDRCDSFFFKGKKYITLKNMEVRHHFAPPKQESVYALVLSEGAISLYVALGVSDPARQAPVRFGGLRFYDNYSNIGCLLLERRSDGRRMVPSNKQRVFLKEMAAFIDDRPDIVQKIRDDIYSIENVEVLVLDYNTTTLKK
ncbi:MAG: hypothetical protein EOO16_17285 [Chitinophagaceae bacterium]|nr:MAG: hypothetical protein EOO16_17285 [Chitinophagaceae bacterium]